MGGNECVHGLFDFQSQLNLDTFFKDFNVSILIWGTTCECAAIATAVTIERSQAKCANCAEKSFSCLEKGGTAAVD